MDEDLPCSLPDTQSQTQGSQAEWALNTPTIPLVWGRLYPTKDPVKTLGIRNTSPHNSAHNITELIDLTKNIFKLGRAQRCDFSIVPKLVCEEVLKNISKEHFLLTRDISDQSSPVIIHDLSYNGTFVNRQKIGKGKTRILENKDEISITHPNFKLFVFMDMYSNEQDQVHEKISEKYYISKTLGVGACGTVKLVYNKMTCKMYAMKVIKKKILSNAQKYPLNDPEKIMNEVNILKALKHPCVISTEEVVDTPQAAYIVMELLSGGELFERVSGCGSLPEKTAKVIFRQMVLAVKYLHDQGITHRDLKPENVLLENSDEEPLIKLTDFGLSKLVGEETFMKTMCGTPLYVAPEVLLAEGRSCYGPQVDVWSLGVMLFICLSGYLPFSPDYKERSLRDQIICGRYRYSKIHWNGVSIAARKLILKLLTVNPSKRITLDEILNEEWMKDDAVIQKVEELMTKSLDETVRDETVSDETVSEDVHNVTIINPSFGAIKRIHSDVSSLSAPSPKRAKLQIEGVLITSHVNTSSEDTEEEFSLASLSFTNS